MNTIRILLLTAIVASFIYLSSEDESLTRVRRAKKEDAEPSQEDIDAVRSALDRRPKVARPAYRPPPGSQKKKNNHGPLPPEVVDEENRKSRKGTKARKGKKGKTNNSKTNSRRSNLKRSNLKLANRRLSPAEKSKLIQASRA